MDDDAVVRRSEVDHLAHRRGIFVPGHDDGARLDLPWATGLIKEGPDVAGLVFVIEVSWSSLRCRVLLMGPWLTCRLPMSGS